ncbi:MAG: amidohydrolase family protein [Acidobacteriaceae bacterium]|nr:amidohydrolase family protein [Acidobacteriaceae bacterium]MBV8571789.1 amidohydrolase family protein [Acidobacteriaceae bacterium]
MSRLDAHQHFWVFEQKEYGWISEDMTALRRDFLPADLKRAAEEAGVNGSIAVQARQTVEETRWLLELSAQNDFIQGVVGWVPLADRRVGDVLEEFVQNRKLRGVRHVLQDEADPCYMLRADFNTGVRLLEPLGLAYDILIYERHLAQTIQFVDRHPAQVFVLDHVAKPRVASHELSPWREHLRELAKRDNVYCKLSGLITEAEHGNWTEADLVPYLEIALETFGPGRLMFGSDWPVVLLGARYGEWVSVVERAVQRLSEAERQRIWSGTAQEAYRLPWHASL